MTEDPRPGARPAAGPPGLSADEQALRELLRRSVADVQPDGAALARIRSGVPRRRAVRRGAWTGAAAVLVGAAVALPALRIPEQLGLTGPAAASTADGGGADDGHSHTGGDGSPAGHLPLPYTWSGPGAAPSSSATAAQSAAPSAAAGVPPSAAAPPGSGSAVAAVPECARTDLGQGTSQVGVPDAAGAVYGSFTLVNTSGHSCTPAGPGAVAVSGANGGDPALVRVVDHLAGDAATALPDPGGVAAAGPLVLAPHGSYRVLFGWVPGAACRRPGSAATASPSPQVPVTASPSPAAAALAAGTDAGEAATAAPGPSAEAEPGAGGGSPSPTATPTGAPTSTALPSPTPSDPAPSITLVYTPQPTGSTTVKAVVDGACGGTVYRMAPQAAPDRPQGVPAAG
ncbi:hypothetical protein [Kitasatospora sp. NPDC057223]|uniref:hypothetical protein n=1 Tax=Kitasatospora sp. NPDC057223 TaxID=3346055 RepID=UPI003631CE29